MACHNLHNAHGHDGVKREAAFGATRARRTLKAPGMKSDSTSASDSLSEDSPNEHGEQGRRGLGGSPGPFFHHQQRPAGRMSLLGSPRAGFRVDAAAHEAHVGAPAPLALVGLPEVPVVLADAPPSARHPAVRSCSSASTAESPWLMHRAYNWPGPAEGRGHWYRVIDSGPKSGKGACTKKRRCNAALDRSRTGEAPRVPPSSCSRCGTNVRWRSCELPSEDRSRGTWPHRSTPQ